MSHNCPGRAPRPGARLVEIQVKDDLPRLDTTVSTNIGLESTALSRDPQESSSRLLHRQVLMDAFEDLSPLQQLLI